jgi:uncharacterized protein (TIGR03435 family)
MTMRRPHVYQPAVIVGALLACQAAVTAQQPRFDVASVKVAADQRLISSRPEWSPGLFRWTTQLWYLVQYAYHVQPWRITGQSLGGTIYVVEAKVDPQATEDQVRWMLRSLLKDRFGLAIHSVNKEVDGYALTVAKGGPKMLIARQGTVPPLPAWMNPSTDRATLEDQISTMLPDKDGPAIVGRRIGMARFSEELERLSGTAVLNQTGLEGTYYLQLRYSTADYPDSQYPPLTTAIGDLGLKLEKRKVPAEILVVDHVEQTPADN